MQVVPFPARQARTHYRHELRHLTYVTLDAANGGIIRNLNREGVAVQAVAPLRPQQRVRVRFELRFPKVRVETFGQVSWSHPSGQCGIRFIELAPRTALQIDEWIFSSLLDMIGRQSGNVQSIFPQEQNSEFENDGLTLSPPARAPIRIQTGAQGLDESSSVSIQDSGARAAQPQAELNWLSRPLSGRTLAWLVDGLLLLAALLLFALIFLSIAHELPPWPLTLGAVSSATALVAASYWALFGAFGGKTLGARLAQGTAGSKGEEEQEEPGRFR